MTSEDTGAYGIDKGQTIVDLLKVVSECVSGDGGDGSMIRLGMTNPPYILQHLDAIATFCDNPMYSVLSTFQSSPVVIMC